MTALKKRAKKKAKKAANPTTITMTIHDDKTFRPVKLNPGQRLIIVGPTKMWTLRPRSILTGVAEAVVP